MIPSTNLMGMRNPEQSVSGNSNLINTISFAGMPKTSAMEESQEPISSNPAEQFLSQFSQVAQPLGNLLKDPNFAFAQKEADLVRRALENYMEAVVTGISAQVQEQTGGELTGNPNQGTPPSY